MDRNARAIREYLAPVLVIAGLATLGVLILTIGPTENHASKPAADGADADEQGAACPRVTASLATYVDLETATCTAALGDELAVDVIVHNAERLAGFSFTVRYDPALMELVRVDDQAQFLTTGNRPELICAPIDDTKGAVNLLCNTMGPPSCSGGNPGIFGTGVLARPIFRPLAEGTQEFEFESTLGLDDVNCEITDDTLPVRYRGSGPTITIRE